MLKLRASFPRLILAVCVLTWLSISSGAQQAPATPPASPTAGSAVPPLPSSFAGRDRQVLDHLNAIIAWYHAVSARFATVGQPSDAIFADNAHALAEEAVQAAFQSASADAVLAAHADNPNAAAGTTSQDFSRLAPQLEGQIAQIKAQAEALAPQIAAARGSQLQTLEEERTRLQGDLELLNAEDVAVEQLARFTSSAGVASNSSLQSSIAKLERTVPEVSAAANASNTKKTSAAPPAAVATSSASTGLIGEAETLFAQATSLWKLQALIKQTSDAEVQAKALRAPLLTAIHDTLDLAASWAQNPASPAATPGTPTSGAPTAGPTKAQFDALTARFKRLAAASVPLSQEIIELDQSIANLTQWQDSLKQEESALFWRVLTKVMGIAVSLGVLLTLSSVWKRFIFRYVHDVRRRRHLLILRRFVIGFFMGVVIVLGFVSEFSSLATFAGFITAGIAVGLQTILLSVAAYFFLIGRYGIRVGDRISIAGTTGDVIDVGLIRLYIMELAGTGTDIFPTGRIVVFPNSVLFQATVPLYKQIPGTGYAWHEVAAPLNATADAKMVSDKLLAAVLTVHESYRGDFERQHAESSRRIDIRLEVPTPSALLQFAATGLEVAVRYPVDLANTAKADQQVTEQVLAALNTDEGFKAAINGTPQIRVAVKG